MKEKKWLVPDVIDPAEKVCVQLEIPNDTLHIAAFWGALEALSKAYNWEDSFADGSATAYVWRDVIADASELVKTGVNCMLDCNDVEDCLETSTIINIIEGDVIINETNITDNTTNITHCTENPPDGSWYPDPPDVDVDPDPACGAAFYIVQELRVFIVDLEASDTTYPTLFDAIAAWLAGAFPFTASLLITVLTSIFGGAPSVLTDYDAQLDDMREELYCNGFDKGVFSTFVRTLTGGDPIADYLDCVGLSAWQQWYTVGANDLSQDCSSYCAVREPFIVTPCFGGGQGGSLVFLGGISWRATSTLRGADHAVTLGSTDGGCFTLSNVSDTIINPGWNGFKHCDDFCNAEPTHSPTHDDHKEFGWTDKGFNPFTVDFDFVPVP